jgi:hypothetical protein
MLLNYTKEKERKAKSTTYLRTEGLEEQILGSQTRQNKRHVYTNTSKLNP